MIIFLHIACIENRSACGVIFTVYTLFYHIYYVALEQCTVAFKSVFGKLRKQTVQLCPLWQACNKSENKTLCVNQD